MELVGTPPLLNVSVKVALDDHGEHVEILFYNLWAILRAAVFRSILVRQVNNLLIMIQDKISEVRLDDQRATYQVQRVRGDLHDS